MKPNPQQIPIIAYEENLVVSAAPGSGKTFVMSEKIRNILPSLKSYQGVIAISYTNKASNELKSRSLKNGLDPKSSFFGTIDSFFISEIIIPFGTHLFGIAESRGFMTLKLNDLEEEEKQLFEGINRELQEEDLSTEKIQILKNYFLQGKIFIETVGVLGNYIFNNSLACRKYLQARYKYIFIDEYQDSGINQHRLFLKIVNLNLIGFAVGDINQSIYKFSHKDSKFLTELTDNPSFKKFYLNKNHRCHISIINYSNYLLNPTLEIIESGKSHVYCCRVQGNEINIATWISQRCEKVKNQFSIEKYSNIAILTRSQRTADIINNNLSIPHKLSLSTSLDNSLNVWSGIYVNLLYFAFDSNFRFIEVIEAFTSLERLTVKDKRTLIDLQKEIKNIFNTDIIDNKKVLNTFNKVARIIAPQSPPGDSESLLLEVLENNIFLNSYKPINENQVNIMTLHKSKGLEFDAVFHLDLYNWILPRKDIDADWVQDLNLHYVGITRARKSCILVYSTQRCNYAGKIIDATPSEFLNMGNIKELRGN